ncbi:MAG: hypothetical protein AAFZ01_07940 [Pseudomonadota bacterium]
MALKNFTSHVTSTTALTIAVLALGATQSRAQGTQLEEISVFATAGGETSAFEFPGCLRDH